MIAERIHHGETAEAIGISPAQFASRKKTLDQYLAQCDGLFSPEGYRVWLQKDPAGDRGLKTQGQSRVVRMQGPRGCGRKKGAPRPRPSKWDMLKAFAREVAKFAAAGCPTVSREEYRQRLAICEGCPEFGSDRRCDVCGCFMDAKSIGATTGCLLGKWPPAAQKKPS